MLTIYHIPNSKHFTYLRGMCHHILSFFCITIIYISLNIIIRPHPHQNRDDGTGCIMYYRCEHLENILFSFCSHTNIPTFLCVCCPWSLLCHSLSLGKMYVVFYWGCFSTDQPMWQSKYYTLLAQVCSMLPLEIVRPKRQKTRTKPVVLA